MTNWTKIHVSPVDVKHQIEVWQHTITHEKRWIPQYSRTGRSWADYMAYGQRVVCTSYASAMKHIKRNKPEDTRKTVAQHDTTHYIW